MNLSAKTVTGSSGKTYRLDQRKDSGGEGDVYTLQSDTTLVAKIYNDQKLNETAPDGSNMCDYMEHKIKLMIGRFSNMNRSYRGSHFPILAWPKDALFQILRAFFQDSVCHALSETSLHRRRHRFQPICEGFHIRHV